ncbi:putative short-chain dehydrogenase [Xylaria bambusicola]|uniref:putative short-chain dehydrogenase n=1 Tax=Xylaria bambusicola TaxID=326684 RepID=UPI002008C47E|nr:putative short-chain dehydrogenase [Xylaria bambusicola]KAI0506258.1 putative short-chain dehydrogenase [Xylaria bambusicola]
MTMPTGTIVLTGANGGLGTVLASNIIDAKDYHGIYTVRDVSSDTVLSSILRRNAVRPTTAGDQQPVHEMVALDLCKPSSVREAAAAINTKVQSGAMPRIQALILNAGLREAHGQTWTDEGLDTTFTSNYLGHWLLTLLLLRSMDKESGRIVVIGGAVHDPLDPCNSINRAFVEDEWKQILVDASSETVDAIAKGEWSASPANSANDPRGLCGIRRYGAAKLCLVMMIIELQNRLNRDPDISRIAILGVDPGIMPTHITVGDHGWLVKSIITFVMRILAWKNPDGLMRTPQKSASDVLAAALSVDPPIGSTPKSVYLNGSQPKPVSGEAQDDEKRAAVWRASVKYTNLKDGETVLVDWA